MASSNFQIMANSIPLEEGWLELTLGEPLEINIYNDEQIDDENGALTIRHTDIYNFANQPMSFSATLRGRVSPLVAVDLEHLILDDSRIQNIISLFENKIDSIEAFIHSHNSPISGQSLRILRQRIGTNDFQCIRAQVILNPIIQAIDNHNLSLQLASHKKDVEETKKSAIELEHRVSHAAQGLRSRINRARQENVDNTNNVRQTAENASNIADSAVKTAKKSHKIAKIAIGSTGGLIVGAGITAAIVFSGGTALIPAFCLTAEQILSAGGAAALFSIGGGSGAVVGGLTSSLDCEKESSKNGEKDLLLRSSSSINKDTKE